MNVLIVDDDKLARKGLVAIMDWESMDSRWWEMYRMGEKPLNFSEIIRWILYLPI